MAISKNDIRFIRSLQQKKVRNAEGLFVVEGKKMLEEILEMRWETKYFISTNEEFCSLSGAILVSDQDLAMCSSFTTPSGYLAVIEKKHLPKLEFKTTNKVVVLDGISDPGNLGTIIRTCEWFGVDGIVLNEHCVELENPKVIQATMGAILRMPTIRMNNSEIRSNLLINDFHMLVADMEGDSIYQFKSSTKWAVVMGSESHGVSAIFKDLNCVHIPRIGQGESLNVGVAAGIILSHLTQS
jgi:TrmH family RNA methyltransferase